MCNPTPGISGLNPNCAAQLSSARLGPQRRWVNLNPEPRTWSQHNNSQTHRHDRIFFSSLLWSGLLNTRGILFIRCIIADVKKKKNSSAGFKNSVKAFFTVVEPALANSSCCLQAQSWRPETKSWAWTPRYTLCKVAVEKSAKVRIWLLAAEAVGKWNIHSFSNVFINKHGSYLLSVRTEWPRWDKKFRRQT